jgi:hypothetical protein
MTDQTPQEKLVFLKRGEVKTMAKDLAQLQEETALRERERLAKLKIEDGFKKETSEREKIASTMIPQSAGVKSDSLETLLPKTKRQSLFSKVIARVMAIVFLIVFLALIGFGYWFLVVKRKHPEPTPSPSPTATESNTPSPSATNTESSTPTPLPIPILPVQEIKILRLAPNDDFEKQLGDLFNNFITPPSDAFFEVLAEKDAKFFGVKEFLEGLKITSPTGFLQALSLNPDDFDLFLYAKNDGEKRLGFLVKVSDESNAVKLEKTWEKTMENDFADFYKLMGKNKPALQTQFKLVNNNGAVFRYLPFQESNLGAAWAIFDNYLLFASSQESMIKAVELLKAAP